MGITVLTSLPAVPILSSSTPTDVVTTAGAVGAANQAARGDHAHKYTHPDSGWLTPALQNGWIPYDTTYGNVAMYRKIGSLVFCRGLVKNGTVGSVIFTLPVGYRPGIRMLFAAETNPNVNCRIDVDINGNINGAGESNGWISLGTVIFVADN